MSPEHRFPPLQGCQGAFPGIVGAECVQLQRLFPVQLLFEAQLDMLALRSFDLPVYRNEAAAPAAVGADGAVWVPSGTGYVSADGPGGATVRLAQNADYRWGPGEWQQDDWANLVRVPVGGDEIAFAGHAPRTSTAVAALAWFIVLVVVAVLGRLRRP